MTEHRPDDQQGDQPDHSEDPRRQDTGDQLPEEAPAEHTGDGQSGGSGGDTSDPSTDGGEDADERARTEDRSGRAPGGPGEEGQSTGNPAAAG